MKHAGPRPSRRLSLATLAVSLALAAASCAPLETAETEERSSEASSSNGFRVNGFRVNGFRVNGFRVNGFRVNGFRVNGLATNLDFADWFNNADDGDTGFHAEVMKYMMACALRADQRTQFTDKDGVTHVWTGALGLAPSWLDPGTSTEDEKSLVTACLMAHVNSAYPDPKHVMISLRGDAPGLATTAIERSALGTFDGVYFGDLFTEGSDPKFYICRPHATLPNGYSQTLLKDWGRQCWFTNDGCGGVFELVDCETACGKAPTGAGYPWGPTCTVDGKSYKAIAAYVPLFRTAPKLTRIGAAVLTSCTGCTDSLAMSGLTSTSNGAKLASFVAHSGDYVLDIRYSNGTLSKGIGTTGYLSIQVNGVTVKNGTSDRWDFPYTGGFEAWATRSIPLTIPAGATITFRGTGAAAPRLDVVALRLP
jgi:hypothetical protein